MSDDWSHEEADDPLYADQRNFYKVEKWSRDGQRGKIVVPSKRYCVSVVKTFGTISGEIERRIWRIC